MTGYYELIIYGVQFFYDDEQDVELSNFELTYVSDDKFIKRAEEEGNVWSLYGFLRKLEASGYGASETDMENMTLRAYLINAKNPDDVIRVDHDNFLFNISELKHVSEVF